MASKKALLLMVDDDGTGQMIADGKAYMVRSSWTNAGAKISSSDGYTPRWTIHVTAVKSLDEEAQRRRIEGLERELERERERLAEIKGALEGSEGADHDQPR